MFHLPLTAAVLIGALISVSAHAQNRCTPIQFAPGTSSATVRGIAPFATPFACFIFAARRGQTATVTLTQSNGNTAFNVGGLIDDQDNYSFATEARTYKIDVYQVIRNKVTPNASFAMQVSVK